jgi:glycosyltransferase involved in cell wall biosynthesis
MLSTHPRDLRISHQIGPRLDRVVIINDFSNARGGATSIALSSAALLNEAGISTTYVTGDSASNADLRLSTTDIVSADCKPIFEASFVEASFGGLYNRSAETLLSRWIAKNDTPRTIYHLHGWSKILSPAIFRPLRSVIGRVVISAHDFFLVCPNGGYYDFGRETSCELRPMSTACVLRSCDRRSYPHKLWRLLRHAIRQATFDMNLDGLAVLPVHDGMLPLLERGGLSRSQMATLRNPVRPWSSTRIRAETNKIFVFVGRLDADKGVDLFVAAARKIGLPIRIIGSGPLEARIGEIYPDAERVPWCRAEDMPNYVRDARVLVMPSRTRETFGLAAFEALTSGIPVAISNLAMIAGEITATGGAIACDPHDQVRFGEILSRLAFDDTLIASMSASAYSRARSMTLTPAEWVARLLEIYGDLLRRSHAGRTETESRICSMARGELSSRRSG